MLAVLSATANTKSNEKTWKHGKTYKDYISKRFHNHSIQNVHKDFQKEVYKLVLPKVVKAKEHWGDFQAM